MKAILLTLCLASVLNVSAEVYRSSGSYITVVNEAKALRADAEKAMATDLVTERLQKAVVEHKEAGLCTNDEECILLIAE